jgi:hypothetical protein
MAQKEVSLLLRVLHVPNDYKRYGFWCLYLAYRLYQAV